MSCVPGLRKFALPYFNWSICGLSVNARPEAADCCSVSAQRATITLEASNSGVLCSNRWTSVSNCSSSMPFSPASLRRGSDCSSSSNIYSTDRRTDHVDDGSLAWIVTENQSETAAALQDLGVALKDSVACLPNTPDPEAYSLSASFDSRRRIHLPGHQLPSRSIDNNATSHKRKYQVTTMGGSPLKLRVSWSHTHSFAVDGSGDNSSPWDALAGEEPYSDNVDPLPACRPISHSQNAASAIQSAFTPPPVRQSGTPVLQPGDEIYEVCPLPSGSFPASVHTTKAITACRLQFVHFFPSQMNACWKFIDPFAISA